MRSSCTSIRRACIASIPLGPRCALRRSRDLDGFVEADSASDSTSVAPRPRAGVVDADGTVVALVTIPSGRGADGVVATARAGRPGRRAAGRRGTARGRRRRGRHPRHGRSRARLGSPCRQPRHRTRRGRAGRAPECRARRAGPRRERRARGRAGCRLVRGQRRASRRRPGLPEHRHGHRRRVTSSVDASVAAARSSPARSATSRSIRAGPTAPAARSAASRRSPRARPSNGCGPPRTDRRRSPSNKRPSPATRPPCSSGMQSSLAWAARW